jgi:hypothetical protein
MEICIHIENSISGCVGKLDHKNFSCRKFYIKDFNTIPSTFFSLSRSLQIIVLGGDVIARLLKVLTRLAEVTVQYSMHK